MKYSGGDRWGQRVRSAGLERRGGQGAIGTKVACEALS